jgi:nucleoid DNA-binding protein
MATKVIKFPVAYRQNNNSYSSVYGKYFPIAWRPETLSLRGLIERVAFSQSVYSRDIIEGVIQKLTTVMVELLRSGQPVKWDGLGMFQPGIEARKNGVSADDMKAKKANPDLDVAGVHINFIPESGKGDDLTSRAFKELCVFENVGVVEYVRKGGEGADKNKVIGTKLVDMDAWYQEQNTPDPEP